VSLTPKAGKHRVEPGEASGPSRRTMLAGGIGVAGSIGLAALVALPDLALASRGVLGTGEATGGTTATGRHFFIYGLPGSVQKAGASLHAAAAPQRGSKPSAAALPIASAVACPPVLSPDERTLALVTVDQSAEATSVTLSLVDTASAEIVSRGTLHLDDVPAGSNILPTPVFAAGTQVVALILAITSPSQWRTISKRDQTGGTRQHIAATWRSHHELAYFDRKASQFTGPFNLANEPALALTSAAANATDLFVWNTAEPQASGPKGTPVPVPLPRLSIYPLGSGVARHSALVPAPWPGGEPVLALPGGDVVRLANGRHLQVVSAQAGGINVVSVPEIDAIRAKPSALTMTLRPDGTLLIVKAGIGRAVVVDPAQGFRSVASVEFPVPGVAYGGPASKAALSPNGEVLYVLGSRQAGGIAGYSMTSGRLVASYSSGTQYSGLYQLPSGTLLTTAVKGPRVSFFSGSLHPAGTLDSTLHVAEVL
jgi:hypothetical protein